MHLVTVKLQSLTAIADQRQTMGVMHSACISVFILGLVYICGNCIRIITMLLVRSDVSAGNSLSVPQLTAVRCHCPLFLFLSLPFLKLIWFDLVIVDYPAVIETKVLVSRRLEDKKIKSWPWSWDPESWSWSWSWGKSLGLGLDKKVLRIFKTFMGLTNSWY